ncbi:MAG: hypothetical protein LBC30_01030, partial [Puniceicoccales bacterium]|nr:hypothetical protein [Puniceicoccales bacterium]
EWGACGRLRCMGFSARQKTLKSLHSVSKRTFEPKLTPLYISFLSISASIRLLATPQKRKFLQVIITHLWRIYANDIFLFTSFVIANSKFLLKSFGQGRSITINWYTSNEAPLKINSRPTHPIISSIFFIIYHHVVKIHEKYNELKEYHKKFLI